MDITSLKIILENDKAIMTILTIIQSLHLKDTWLCAGTIRNYIWNLLLLDKKMAVSTDIDVIFFDPKISDAQTLALERKLKVDYPNYSWELKNQVYMHKHSPNTLPYKSATDAISKFPEICTAIGIRLDQTNRIDIFAPYGITDISHFIVRPTPHFLEDKDRIRKYNQRISKKKWQEKWPSLTFYKIE